MSSEFVPAQTSVPAWLMTYCRQLADVYYDGKLNRMYLHILESFLANEPWKADPPFDWIEVRTHGVGDSRADGEAGWKVMNMHLPTPLYEQLISTIDVVVDNGYSSKLRRKLSLRMFLYTAVSWWATYVYPYTGPGIIKN